MVVLSDSDVVGVVCTQPNAVGVLGAAASAVTMVFSRARPSRRGMNAGVSLLFVSICRWARTVPSWSIADGSHTAFRPAALDPRSYFPSTATARHRVCPACPGVSSGLQERADRDVEDVAVEVAEELHHRGGMWHCDRLAERVEREVQGQEGPTRRVRDPLGDRGQGPCTGQDACRGGGHGDSADPRGTGPGTPHRAAAAATGYGPVAPDPTAWEMMRDSRHGLRLWSRELDTHMISETVPAPACRVLPEST